MSAYTFNVVNVVGTGQLPAELDLKTIPEDIKGETWENESPQPGLHLQFEEDGPMTTFYRSGSYIIRAADEAELDAANKELLEELARLGIVDEDEDIPFDISNVVCLARLDQHVELSALAIALGLEHTEYEPEQFPALVYRRAKYPCTFLVFANGKIVVPGADSVEDAKDAFETFYDELDEWLDPLSA